MPSNTSQPVAFIGIDLAWQSDKNPSGFAVAIGGQTGARLSCVSGSANGLHQVLRLVKTHSLEHTVVAIDAPLVIRNKEGQRRCERLIGSEFGGRGASAHSTNLTRYPKATSVELERALRSLGFVHPPAGLTRCEDINRLMLEVYPHPAMIQLFELPRRLAYKKGRVCARRRGLAELSNLLAERLPRATPALHNIDPYIRDPVQLRGRSLKEYEDSLDALICSYLALHYWSTRGEGNKMFGDAETGYIIVPSRSLRDSACPPHTS